MSLNRIMNRNIKKIAPTATIQDAARIMVLDKIGALLVENGGEFVGIITETDIVRKAAALGLDLKKELIEKIMSRPIISMEQTRTPQEAFDLMGDAGVRHLAIADRGRIVGFISVRDLLVHFKRQSEPQMGID
ncbi:MAG TPA: CBS domain-containing protein [Nitrospiria bacterium]